MAGWMAPFAGLFTRPTWSNLLVLVEGAMLAPGRRTVTAVLSSMGQRETATFTNYHRVLNRSRWSGRAASRSLLEMLIRAFVPTGPVVIAIDETIERRWGPRIAARGIYRDPVRSSKGHFVKASGLRWISLMLLAPIPWARLTSKFEASGDTSTVPLTAMVTQSSSGSASVETSPRPNSFCAKR